MPLSYGLNITASNMKKILEENERQQSGIRSWRQLFGNTSLNYMSQSDSLQDSYASAAAEAYKSNLARQNAIMGAGLNTGATREAIGATRADLLNAYNTYIANYAKEQSALDTEYAKEMTVIDTALNERATNFANLYNSAYKYLTDELYGSSFVDAVSGETVDVFKDQGLDWLYAKDAQGNPTTDLMSWYELSNILFNSDGSLTKKGTEFYDQMFNTIPQKWQTDKGEAVRGFDQWLSEQSDVFENYDSTNLPGMAKTGKELRDWWVSQDAFNYTLAGTNKGTAQSVIGLESTDQKYAPYEYTELSDYKFKPYDFDTAKSDWSKAYDEYNRIYSDSSGEYDKWAKAQSDWSKAQNGVWGAGDKDKYERAKSDWENYQKKLNEAGNKIGASWQKYLADLNTNYKNVLDDVKKNLGAEKYEEFFEQNKKIFSEFEALLNEARDDAYGQTYMESGSISVSYNKLMQAIDEYIKKHTYSGKTSGF